MKEEITNKGKFKKGIKTAHRKGNFSPRLNPGPKGNDVGWDTKLPSLTNAASSIIFNARYGFNYDVVPNYSFTSKNTAVPGIIALPFRMTLAQTGNDADAINVCAKNLYTYIRHANSGATNYEQSDLIQYVLSILHIAMHVEQAKRMLRLVPTYSATNIYVFKSALIAMGCSTAFIQDMIDYQANYITKINILVAKLNTFKVPKDFSVFDRASWMVTNIFKDDELDKASYYFYYTQDHAHYDWSMGKVIQTEYPFNGITDFQTYLNMIDTEINNLLSYEDIGIMIGDILKAYKADGCRIWTPMQIGEVQDSAYSMEVLNQIMNTVTVAAHDPIEINQVALNSQLIRLDYQAVRETFASGHIGGICTEDSSQSYNCSSINNQVTPLLVIDSDSPTNDDVIVSTRCTQAPVIKYYTSPGLNYPYLDVEVHNLFIVTDIVVVARDANGNLTRDVVHTINFYNNTSNNLLYEARAHKYSRIISKFPTLYRFLSESSNLHLFAYYNGKNIITITNTWLNTLNDGCTQSELTLPMFKLLTAE